MNPSIHHSDSNILNQIFAAHNSLEQKMKGVRTANQVADILFPVVAKEHKAFLELTSNVNELPVIELVDLNEDFWVWTIGWKGGSPSPIVYSQTENLFRRFSESKGIYEPITESMVVNAIQKNLDLAASPQALLPSIPHSRDPARDL
jgi:hypothetical protein